MPAVLTEIATATGRESVAINDSAIPLRGCEILAAEPRRPTLRYACRRVACSLTLRRSDRRAARDPGARRRVRPHRDPARRGRGRRARHPLPRRHRPPGGGGRADVVHAPRGRRRGRGGRRSDRLRRPGGAQLGLRRDRKPRHFGWVLRAAGGRGRNARAAAAVARAFVLADATPHGARVDGARGRLRHRGVVSSLCRRYNNADQQIKITMSGSGVKLLAGFAYTRDNEGQIKTTTSTERIGPR